MTAEIRSLNGEKIEVAPSKRNQRIAEMLAMLAEMNDRGEIFMIAGVTVRPDGAWTNFWSTPSREDTRLPWDLVLRGALATVDHEMGAAAQDTSPPPPDDGA